MATCRSTSARPSGCRPEKTRRTSASSTNLTCGCSCVQCPTRATTHGRRPGYPVRQRRPDAQRAAAGQRVRAPARPARRRSPRGTVFAGRGGDRPLDVSTIRRIVQTAARCACLEPRVSPHWLRHAHATHALEHQAPIRLVQATLGHALVATTGRYAHARPTESSATDLSI
ncbi:MAG: tyrosine-type recombinase/integrase [Chloroflexota bacterium]